MTLRTAAATCLLAAMTMAGTALGQQRDARPAPPPAKVPAAPTGTASVSGLVVADATGSPIGLATVVLIGTRTGVLKVTSTNREGVFTFGALPADRYTVGASRLPYLGAVAGARRAARPGAPIVVDLDEQVRDVTIRLPLGAALSGTIVDQNGQPIANVSVAILQRKVQNGERVLLRTSANIVTDDRGQYRAFGLPPGEYVVSAVAGHQPVGLERLTDADVDGVLAGRMAPVPATGPRATLGTAAAPVYYPGTVRSGDAAGVLVAAGDERTGLDFALQTVQPGRIDGVVTTADGSPLPPQVTVMISSAPGSSALSTGGSARPTPDGRFTMANQPPNTYVVVARTPSAFGVTTVELQGGDVATAHVVLQPPLTIAGRIATAGTTKPAAIAGLRFQFAPVSMALSGAAAPQVAPSGADGAFRITNVVPGRYVFSGEPFFGASNDSVTWGVAAVTFDGRDVTDRAIEIAADAPPKEIVVTLTEQSQSITGRITNEQGAGVGDYTMLVFPQDEAYWLYNSRRIVTAQPDRTGQYQIGGRGPALLPPGSYYLAAVTDVSKDEMYDPAFLRSLLPTALRVDLAAGSVITQNVRVQ